MHVRGACRRKVKKTVYFQYSKSQKGHYSYKYWWELTTLQLDLKYSKIKSYVNFQLNMSKHVREKCGILSISSILSYKKWQNSYKNWRKLTTLELDRMFIRRKWHAKFQVNRSKHVGGKCRKLCISSILSSKRGIIPTKINGNWRHSNLICSTVKQSHMQNVKACRRKQRKTVYFQYFKFQKRHNSYKNWR